MRKIAIYEVGIAFFGLSFACYLVYTFHLLEFTRAIVALLYVSSVKFSVDYI